jgi:hypothetical protein
MQAQVGDWLVTDSRNDHARQGLVLQVHGDRGQPPYLVRWLDTGHEALVFPGPDSQVLTADQVHARGQRDIQRIDSVQAEINGHAEPV